MRSHWNGHERRAGDDEAECDDAFDDRRRADSDRVVEHEDAAGARLAATEVNAINGYARAGTPGSRKLSDSDPTGVVDPPRLSGACTGYAYVISVRHLSQRQVGHIHDRRRRRIGRPGGRKSRPSNRSEADRRPTQRHGSLLSERQADRVSRRWQRCTSSTPPAASRG
jgi:hypothetical protein